MSTTPHDISSSDENIQFSQLYPELCLKCEQLFENEELWQVEKWFERANGWNDHVGEDVLQHTLRDHSLLSQLSLAVAAGCVFSSILQNEIEVSRS